MLKLGSWLQKALSKEGMEGVGIIEELISINKEKKRLDSPLKVTLGGALNFS